MTFVEVAAGTKKGPLLPGVRGPPTVKRVAVNELTVIVLVVRELTVSAFI